MKAVQGAICSVIRTAGQSLDALGRGLEVTPYVEKRKLILICRLIPWKVMFSY